MPVHEFHAVGIGDAYHHVIGIGDAVARLIFDHTICDAIARLILGHADDTSDVRPNRRLHRDGRG